MLLEIFVFSLQSSAAPMFFLSSEVFQIAAGMKRDGQLITQTKPKDGRF